MYIVAGKGLPHVTLQATNNTERMSAAGALDNERAVVVE